MTLFFKVEQHWSGRYVLTSLEDEGTAVLVAILGRHVIALEVSVQ